MPSFSLISLNQFAIEISSVGQADRAFVFFNFRLPHSNFRIQFIPTSEISLRAQNSYLIPASAFRLPNSAMVGVAQLVEPQVVALVVVGSSPITHPIKN